VAELADAFTQDEDPNELLFDLLRETLGRLDKGHDPTLVVRYYELHLLALAGYQPQLFRCVQCNELLRPEINFLSLERGGALCPKHGAHRPESIVLSLPALKVLRFLQSRPWTQVAPLRLGPEVSRQVEQVLARYIVYHLERNLRSAAFLERLRQSLATTDNRLPTAAG
jgi:DNA repair protein RecO (recombination protein O)